MARYRRRWYRKNYHGSLEFDPIGLLLLFMIFVFVTLYNFIMQNPLISIIAITILIWSSIYISNFIKRKKQNLKPGKEKLDINCPECSGKLVNKQGKYGNFIGCSNFPKCRYIKKN